MATPAETDEKSADLVTTDVTAAPSTATPTGDTAASPPAEGEKSPTSMLEAVQAAIKKDGTEASPASQAPDADKSTPEPDYDGSDIVDLDAKALAPYAPRTRKQIQFLLHQRRELKSKVEGLSPKADGFDRITDFVEKAGLSSEDVNIGFEAMRLSRVAERGDTAAAQSLLEMLRPIVVGCQRVLGVLLPKDLHEQVTTGHLPEAAATELAQRRSREEFQRNESQRAAEAARNRAATDTRQAGEACAAAVTEWDVQWQGSDPDYKAKLPRVTEKIEANLARLSRENKAPRTPVEAKALAQRCLQEVNDDIARWSGKPRAINPPPTSGVASRPVAAPTSILDIVRARGNPAA